MDEHWIRLDLNPEPWAIGDVGTGRKGGKVWAYISPNAQLTSFQEAVKEELLSRHNLPSLASEECSLKFYFWRRLDSYESSSGKRVQKHQTDATNLQKGLEDALQGILIKNDSLVRDIQSKICSQDNTTEPMILIKIKPFDIKENLSLYVPPYENPNKKPIQGNWDTSLAKDVF